MDWQSIIDFIESVVQSVIDFIVQIAQALYNIIVDVFNAVVSVIQDIWNWLSGIWGTLKDFFDDVWWQVITPFIEWVQQIVDDITTWLQNFLDPIIEWIQRIQKWYTTYLKPIITDITNVISALRIATSLLAKLGVKWAKKLDQDLQIVQSWLTTILRDISAGFNSINQILGLMVDPSGILRRDFFTGTLFSSISALKQATAFGSDRASSPGELNQIAQNQGMVRADKPLATIAADGTVSYSPGVGEINASVQQAMTDLGVTSLPN
jgi:hypothetical protein